MTQRFPSDISKSNAYISFTFKQFKKFDTSDLKSANDKQYKGNSLASISLPVPNNLETMGAINWNGIGTLISETAIKAKEGLSSKAVYAETELGKTTDKPTQMSFDSVSLRSFSWSWELIPRNAKEAKDIEDIIYWFEYSKLPEKTQKIGATYPFVVQPKLKSNNRLLKYLPCVITNVSVNYAVGGDYREYKDGGLPVYGLTVSVSEIASLNKTIYKDLIGR